MRADQVVLCGLLVLASGGCWLTAALYSARRIGPTTAGGVVVACWSLIGWLAWGWL